MYKRQALMYAAGGPDFFNKATHYEEGIWDTAEAQTCFDIVTKLASYTCLLYTSIGKAISVR